MKAPRNKARLDADKSAKPMMELVAHIKRKPESYYRDGQFVLSEVVDASIVEFYELRNYLGTPSMYWK